MKNKKNKWWNFFKFKFNKSKSKHDPNMENDNLWDQQLMGNNTTNCRRFVISVGNPKRKWWQFRKNHNDKKRSHNEVSRLIGDYQEDIHFDNSGEININNQENLPYNRQMWFPSDNRRPNIDTLNNN